MFAKQKRKKIIAIVSVFFICGIGLFLTLKTTVIAGLIACISENENIGEYVEIKMMPEEYTFSSYKNMLVNEIRVNKAIERKAQRKEFIYGKLQKLSNQMKDSYVYIEEAGWEKENLEKYNNYIKQLDIEAEKEFFKDMLSEMAKSAYLYMSTDVYYPGYKREQIKTLAKGLYTDLAESTVTETFILEPMYPSEYDDVPEIGISKNYSEDILNVENEVGTDKYDYIAEIAMNYTKDDGTVVLEEQIVAIVGESVFEIIEAKVSLPEEYCQIAAVGSIRPYSVSETEKICSTIEPIIINMDGMQAKAEEFLGLFKKIMGVYFSNEEALNEFYENYFMIEEENEEDSVTDVSQTENEISGEYTADDITDMSQSENISQEMIVNETQIADTTEETTESTEETETEEEVKYEDLLFAQIEKEILTEIENTYSYEKEWGPYLVLDEFSDFMQNGVNSILTKRKLDEGETKIFGEEITEEEKNQIYTNAKVFEKIYKNNQEIKLIESAALTEEEILTILTSAKDGVKGHQNGILGYFSYIKQSFEKGYLEWCGETIPECILGTYFRYKIEGLCEIEMTLLDTTEGIYITGIGIYWNSEEEILQDMKYRWIYERANTVFMRKKAEEAISRDAYETEEEYEEAIIKWLYENYPQYYNSKSNTGKYSFVDYIRIFGIKVAPVEVGTWKAYLFSPNGYFNSFAEDVRDISKDVYHGVKNFVEGVISSFR